MKTTFRIIKLCKICGKEMYVLPCLLERTKCCSRSCSNRYIHTGKKRTFTIKHRKNIGLAKIGKKSSNFGKRHPGLSKSMLASKNSQWKGGSSTNYEYRIWEEHWRETPPKGYLIHHVDRNPKNNHIANLALITRSTHALIHNAHRRRNACLQNMTLNA